MNRECKTLNLDECRTRADCGTRKKPKSDDLMCVKKPVRAPKQDVSPPLARKASVAPKAPRMTAAHKAEIVSERPKLAFGKKGSFCVGMSESDCGKAKTACHWTNKSEDGKRTVKAHCGRRAETSYEGMAELSKFNSKRYYDEELSPEEIKQARWAKAAASVNSVSRPALPFGKDSLCVGMKETDCVKSKPCQWTKESKDGKRKAHCGRRIEGKGTVFQGVGTKVGGKSDPVLRLFYGY
jgi:hypothetical protein